MILFENDKLLPIALNLSNGNYDVLSLANTEFTASSPPLTTTTANRRACSQIIAVRASTTNFVLSASIELHLPLKYTRLLKLMHGQLSNRTASVPPPHSPMLQHHNIKMRVESERNLFDRVFQTSGPSSSSADAAAEATTVMVISNGELATEAASSSMIVAGSETEDAKQRRRDERFVRNENAMTRLRRDMSTRWLNPGAYEVVFAMLAATGTNNNDTKYTEIEFAGKRENISCRILGIDINWVIFFELLITNS